MALYSSRTFADLVAAVREELGIQSSDTNAINRIKRDINLVYQEITAEKNWWWLEGHTTIQVPAYINAGTVSVTQGSSSITFSSAPTASQKGKLFSVDGFNEIYVIDSHTAGATTAKISEFFAGTTNATANYKLFTDRLPLPVDLKETTEVWHDYHHVSLEGQGKQDYRRICTAAPKAEGKPAYYYTGDYADAQQLSSITSLPSTSTRASAGVIKTIVFASSLPTALVSDVSDGKPVYINISAAGSPSYNGNVLISAVSTTSSSNDTITYIGKAELQESSTADTSISIKRIDQESDFDRYRELYIYPYLTNSLVTLHVDYVKEIMPLDNDTDEPSIPVQDRLILIYGALHRGWSRLRNPEEATRNYTLYQNKLAKMAGKLTDTFDKPKLQPSRLYLNAKRTAISRLNLNPNSGFGSGGTSGQSVTGTASRAAQFSATGNLEASSTVSTTELGYLDGVTSNIQTQLDTITTLADGTIYVGNASNVATEVTPSGDVTMSNAGVTAISAGVIVNADINASAAIARSKTASGTAYRILANDGSGVMSENAALTASQAVVSDSNGQLATTASLPIGPQTVALNDNQSSADNVLTWTASTYDIIHLRYSIKRGSAILESGEIHIATDGTNASIAQAGASVGTTGVTFTVDVSGGSLRLRYTSTSTGTAPSFKYIEEKWAA